MPDSRTSKRSRREIHVLKVDSDQLGLLAGALLATTVVAIGLYRGVGATSVLLRAAVAFLLAYVVVFFLVMYIQRLRRTELARRRRARTAPAENREGAEAE